MSNLSNITNETRSTNLMAKLKTVKKMWVKPTITSNGNLSTLIRGFSGPDCDFGTSSSGTCDDTNISHFCEDSSNCLF